jgi:hypothetical protein
MTLILETIEDSLNKTSGISDWRSQKRTWLTVVRQRPSPEVAESIGLCCYLTSDFGLSCALEKLSLYVDAGL